MSKEFLESQIERRRKSDDEMFQGAFSDLLSIVGINALKAAKQTKGSVAEILKYLGREVPDVPDNITDLDSQLEYMLRPSCTMRRRVELKGNWWKDSTGCFLGSTKDGDVVSILPGAWSGYFYRTPQGEEIKVNEKTAKNLNVDAFCFYKSFPLRELKIRDLIKFMISNFSKADIAFILATALVLQLLGMFTPHVTRVIYNILIPSGQDSLILPIAFSLFGITIGSMILGIVNKVVTNRFRTRFILTVNSAVMIRFFSLPTKFFKNYTSGELASRMGHISLLCQEIVSAVMSTGLTTFFSFGYLFQMYLFAPSLVVPGMIIIVINILYMIFMTIFRQRIYRKKLDLSPKLQSLVFALFGGIQKIKIAGAEKRAFAKWAEQYSEVEKLDYSPPLLIKISGVISIVISSLGTILLYYSAITNGVNRGDYMAFSAAYGTISSALMTLSGVALEFANIGPTLNLIRPVLNEKPESSSGRKILTSISGDIEISNITFKYNEDGPTILDDLSLSIKQGEYLGIVGKTGCGKSTLIRILLGFEKPQQGTVFYGGRDLSNLDLRSVRQKIGVVMQNGSLFPGDIFSNIIVTSPWKTIDDAWEAARIAGIEEDIRAMPMGMHTVISEGAGGISGGQKQRLMIARAIISKPKILIFDEATSALDNITQKHVSDSISSFENTRIVVAHRLSTIKNCDRIIVLDQGKVAEEGTYEELMRKKGQFYDLAIRQISE